MNTPNITSLCLASALIFVPITFAKPLNYRELRYSQTIGQSNWFTCSAAATATQEIKSWKYS